MDNSGEIINNNPTSPVIKDIIDITIKTIDSKNFQFQVESDIEIKAFKEKIAPTVGVDADSQRFIFCGRVLADKKTLKDYNIDNGKVIHLVKISAPPQRTEAQNTSNTQQNETTNRTRFRSYRNDDGSVFMGTFALEPNANMFNQLMRQLFNGNRTNSTNNASDSNSSTTNSSTTQNNQSNSNQEVSTPNSNVVNRFQQIRRLLGYIETNFQILENPSFFPSLNSTTEQGTTTISDYVALFNQTLAAYDRLRPQLNSYLQAISNSNLNEVNFTNYSILMRISHHLSHVYHLLTDFTIDPNNTSSPISVNVLDSSINASVNSNSVPARVEMSTTGSTDSTNNLSRFSSMPGMLVAQSPIVLMEVDATITGSRNFMSGGPRPLSNFSLSDFNFTINNLASNVNPTSSTSTTSNNVTTNTTTTNSLSSTTPTDSNTNQQSEIRPPSQTNNSTNESQANQNGETNSTNINPFQFLSRTFDPFLPCNSNYSVPEVRSAAQFGTVDMVTNNLNQSLQQMISNLSSVISNPEENSSGNNPLFTSLNDLLSNLENSSSQISEESDFFELIRFLIDQINPSNENGSNNSVPNSINVQNIANMMNNLNNSNSFRISDYLRTLNLISTENQNAFSDFLSLLFQNIGFEDLFQLINSNFHEFNRFREPFQNFIRNNLLNGCDCTLENIKRELEKFVTENQNVIATILAGIKNASGVDHVKSFENFIKEVLSNFLYKIIQSNSDNTFEEDLLSALKYLLASYVQFTSVCFSGNNVTTHLIQNFFEHYTNYLNSIVQRYLVNIVTDRIYAFTNDLQIDQSIVDQVNSYIVYSAPEREVMQVETSEQDVQSISNDSELEFVDAVFEVPSTSETPQQESSVGSEDNKWQSVVPNDWVPIIREDINKQKNIDTAHKPPFSDAYLNGMPKKRRLENQPNNDDNDPKIRQK